ncbi:MAG: DUF302 domain-containing protein [Proteobacteria bacterium]|nr:DUF302 domain-containing protein [Pseudomonadota bacterium]MDA1022252.1 DUF302 domain-containing protein [Pseudomonadota bacterium]
MRLLLLSFLIAVLALPVRAENPTPYSGTQVIETGQPFDVFVKKLTASIAANKMGLVGNACATCGARNIGVTIPGNRVMMIFNPHFAVRMLKASEASGIEAPLRLYITEQPNGKARLTYRLPSHVFGVYKVPALDKMAKELDEIFARIVSQATG